MKITRLVLIGCVAVSVAGCGATMARRSFKESLRDGMIKTAVRYKLSKDRDVKARHMEIDVWRGVVTLHGRTVDLQERARAEELARSTKHVVAVENYLKAMNESTPVVMRDIGPTAMPTARAMPSTTPVVTATSAGMVASPTVPTPKPPQPAPTISSAARTTPAQIPTDVSAKKAAVTKMPAAKVPATTAVAPAKTPKPTLAAVESRPDSIAIPRPTPVSTPTVTPIGAPAKNAARPVAKGKTLPWLGEVADEEGPAMQPVKEIAERPRPATAASSVSADEDLAREAAEELKRLRSSSPR